MTRLFIFSSFIYPVRFLALAAVLSSANPLHRVVRQESLSTSISASSSPTDFSQLTPVSTFESSSSLPESSTSVTVPTSATVSSTSNVSQTTVSCSESSSVGVPSTTLEPPSPSSSSLSPPPSTSVSSQPSPPSTTDNTPSSFSPVFSPLPSDSTSNSDGLPPSQISESLPPPSNDAISTPTATAPNIQNFHPTAQPTLTPTNPDTEPDVTDVFTDADRPSANRTFSFESSPTATGDSSESGFLDNKGAVAATFTVACLVLVGILAAVFILLQRRQRSKRFASDNFDFYEKSRENGHIEPARPPDRDQFGRDNYYTVESFEPTNAPFGGSGSAHGHSDHGLSQESGYGGSSEYYGEEIPQDPFNSDSGPIVPTTSAYDAATYAPHNLAPPGHDPYHPSLNPFHGAPVAARY